MRRSGRLARTHQPRRIVRRHGERGVALVELALVTPVVAVLVFTAIDLGRLAQYQNRMSNAAREAAAMAQVIPASVDAGCRGDRNVEDRARLQEPKLVDNPGYSVSIALEDQATGELTTYVGCTEASTGSGDPLTIGPGDHLVVTVTADVGMSSPVTSAFAHGTAHLRRRIEVVVQG